jgi:hypothetical protein
MQEFGLTFPRLLTDDEGFICANRSQCIYNIHTSSLGSGELIRIGARSGRKSHPPPAAIWQAARAFLWDGSVTCRFLAATKSDFVRPAKSLHGLSACKIECPLFKFHFIHSLSLYSTVPSLITKILTDKFLISDRKKIILSLPCV